MNFKIFHKNEMCTIRKCVMEEGNQYKIELTRSLGGGYWVECFNSDEEAIKEVKEYIKKGYPIWWDLNKKRECT